MFLDIGTHSIYLNKRQLEIIAEALFVYDEFNEFEELRDYICNKIKLIEKEKRE